MEKTYFETISALALAVDAKDKYSRGHLDRVADYCVQIANKMGLDDEEIAAALAQSGVIASVVRMCVCDNQLHILWMKLTFIICIRL